MQRKTDKITHRQTVISVNNNYKKMDNRIACKPLFREDGLTFLQTLTTKIATRTRNARQTTTSITSSRLLECVSCEDFAGRGSATATINHTSRLELEQLNCKIIRIIVWFKLLIATNRQITRVFYSFLLFTFLLSCE